MPATLCSELQMLPFRAMLPMKMWHKALLYPGIKFIKTILICWRLYLCSHFQVGSSRSLKQGFLLFHNMPWLLEMVTFYAGSWHKPSGTTSWVVIVVQLISWLMYSVWDGFVLLASHWLSDYRIRRKEKSVNNQSNTGVSNDIRRSPSLRAFVILKWSDHPNMGHAGKLSTQLQTGLWKAFFLIPEFISFWLQDICASWEIRCLERSLISVEGFFVVEMPTREKHSFPYVEK